MTADEANALRPLVLSAYLGEECQGCHRTFETFEELAEAVYWPWAKGRIGHRECFAQRTLNPHER